MSKLMIALGNMLPQAAKGRTCPDCGGEMQNGECQDCGYGSEDNDMGEEEDEQLETQTLLDLKKQLQSAMDLVDRLIVNNCD
jgi:hypothetical protein